jgi:hypothetical protein
VPPSRRCRPRRRARPPCASAPRPRLATAFFAPGCCEGFTRSRRHSARTTAAAPAALSCSQRPGGEKRRVCFVPHAEQCWDGGDGHENETAGGRV